MGEGLYHGLAGPSLDASMGNPGMEHSGPSVCSDLMDFLADYREGELSCGAGGGMEGLQDLLAPPAIPQAKSLPSPPFFHLEDINFSQSSLEGAGSNPETFTGKPSTELAPSVAELSSTEVSSCPPESWDCLSEEQTQLPQEVPQPESLNVQGKSSNDATQVLFWASILQAQRCVLDLQGEIDRQKEPQEVSSLSPKKMTPTLQGVVVSDEPSLLDSDSEESLERQEEDRGSFEGEEEEEEEEEEYLFYNNPLFQESPRPRATTSFEELAMWCCPEEEEEEESTLESGLDSRDHREDWFCQGSVAGNPVSRDSFSGLELEAGDGLSPSPIPTYVPHCRSLSPLVITEGDLESTCPSAESTAIHDCFPDQLAQTSRRTLLEGMAADPSCGMDLPGEGLLFSASSTCLVSALLHEPEESGRPQKPPTPEEIGWTPVSCQVFSALPVAEPSLGQEDIRRPVPFYAWGMEPDAASCLEEEVTTADWLCGSGGEVARNLESGVEGLEMVQVPLDRGREPLQEEHEESPTLHCPEEAPQGPSNMGGLLHAKEPAEPNGLLLLASGASGDQAAAQRLAARLYHLDGFKRSQVASFLRKNNEFSQRVTEAFLSFFQFSGQTLDQALRSFLKAFVLTGETQERERILRHFSHRYHACNPETFLSSDAVHTLTCAIMLLNTDLHGQNIGRSMSCPEFLANLEGLNNGQDFPKEQLKVLYHSIRHEKLEWAMDEEEVSGPRPPLAASSGSPLPSQKKSNPFLTLVHDPSAKTYRQGLLARKVHAEADGKKTPWGKRGWKTFRTVLKGMVLYFFKDESRPDAGGSEEPIGVHHALAEKANKYTKRPNVFRLQTADWRIFLFQAPTPEEMSSWVSRINLAAAMFSSPPFPAAVGSQRKFIRPVLPTAPSKASLEHQHQTHEGWMDKMYDSLLEHQRNLPDKRGRGRDLDDYQLKKEYLLYEKRRYETYVRLLEVKLNSGTEDLEQWEACLADAEPADEGPPGMKKSHSSPSLNVDGPPVGVKVKRNISERRTVRKIIPRRNKHLL